MKDAAKNFLSWFLITDVTGKELFFRIGKK
jgi:hypothetical protein